MRLLPLLLAITLATAIGCTEPNPSAQEERDTGAADVGLDAEGDVEVDAPDDPLAPADIVFPEAEFVVQLDAIRRPEVEVINAAGEVLDVRVSFESSDPSILEISSAGFAVGRALGSVELRVRAGELEKVWPARVSRAPVASVDVVPANYTLEVGQAVEYLALPRDAGDVVIEEDVVVTWSTSHMGVASIDNRGIARGLSVGTVEVVATIDGVEGRANLEVVEAQIGSVAISPRNPEAIYPGLSVTLEAIALSEEGDPLPWLELSWASSDASVAMVSGGVVTGVGVGTATISASYGEVSDAVEVDVIFSVQEVFAGEGMGCAIAVEQLYCWGDLSDGGVPSRVGFGPGIQDVSLGGGHGCLIDANDVLYCWGRNDYGQAGRFAGGPVASPQRVGTRSYVAVSAGEEHTCAVDDQGDIYCWGRNDERQAGHAGESTHLPIQVGGGYDFVLTAAGSRHSCGVTTDDLAYCWGANDRGQLGDGNTSNVPSEVPKFVDGGYTFAYLEAGEDFSCGLSPSGLPVCWGGNDRGQIGNAANSDVSVPRTLALPVGRGLSSLTVGRDHACGLSQGEVLCWGAFEDGRLGAALSEDQNAPRLADFPQRFVQIDAGDGMTCGWTEDLEIFCWGREPGAGATPAAVAFETF